MPDREGRFRGPILEAGCYETEKENICVELLHKCAEYWDGTRWVDIAAQDWSIKSYGYLMKRSDPKNPASSMVWNETTLKGLKEAIGWDGVDFDFFTRPEDMTSCQVVVGWDEYNGTRSLKVKYVNGYDSEGGVGCKKGDTRALTQKFGMKLRAINGGAPMAAPKIKPPTPAPALPSLPPLPAAPPKPAVSIADLPIPTDATSAWTAINEIAKRLNVVDAKTIEGRWFEVIDQISGQSDPTLVSNWSAFNTVATKLLDELPF